MPDSEQRISALYKRVTTGFTMNTIDTVAGFDSASGITNRMGLRTTLTRSYGNSAVFVVTGAGQLTGLYVVKPSTVNSVGFGIALNVDGVWVCNNSGAVAASTGQKISVFVGPYIPGAAEIVHCGPIVIPFRTYCELAVSFSGNPGGGESLTVDYGLVYR